jgi:hypothetical protein
MILTTMITPAGAIAITGIIGGIAITGIIGAIVTGAKLDG